MTICIDGFDSLLSHQLIRKTMKKVTYNHSTLEVKQGEVTLTPTGRTRDMYFAEGETIPRCIVEPISPAEKTSSSIGYSKSYSSKYEETFGNN